VLLTLWCFKTMAHGLLGWNDLSLRAQG
jgi:hypothetical protein